jgi:mannose-6-phosphate isomerase-like protein (cupin superfamily)
MTAIPTFPHLPEKVVRLADVEPIRWGGEEAARFLLRGDDTGGLYSYYEVSVPAGEGSIFHVHEDMDETFFVVEGEFEVKIDDTVHAAPEGVLVYGPRGRGHSFHNTWDKPSKMLCVTTPGGIEDFFTELSALMSEPSRPDWERMSELAAKHRIIAHRPLGGPHGGPPAA